MSRDGAALVMPGPGEPWLEEVRAYADPGPGEVLVAVGAASLNYHDFANSLGFIDGPWPRVPLTDGAGTVVAVGPDVDAWQVGDRVLSTFYPLWQDGPITPEAVREVPSDTCDGWLQEHRTARADELVAVPAHLSLVEAASLPCAATTAWSALEVAGTGPGDVVVAMGTGGVSMFVLQLAKARGARVIALSSSDDKLAVAAGLGADDLVNYRSRSDWHAAVHELTDGRGADLVVDVAGPETLASSVRSVRYGGSVAVIGVVSGFGDAELPVAHVMLRNTRVVGVTVGSVAATRAMAAEVGRHGIRPHLSHVLDWREHHAALELLQSGAHLGKIGLTITEQGNPS